MLTEPEYSGLQFGTRPLAVAVVLFVGLSLARALIRRRADARTSIVWAVWPPLLACYAVCYAALLSFIATSVWYASDPHFFDAAEPSIPAVGWLFLTGQPIYHAIDSAERYVHIYGPLAFMAHGAVLGMFGPEIAAAKFFGVATAFASLAIVYVLVRQHLKARPAAALTGGYALVLLAFRNASYWTRPEPLQLLAVAASLMFALSARTGSSLLTGIASGLLWNMKFTGPLYSLPIFVVLQLRLGWWACVTALLTAATVAAAPFVLFDNVSLANYLDWIRLSANTGLLLSLLRQNIEWAVFMGLPLLLSYYALPAERRPGDAEWRWGLLALLAGTVGVIIAASKPGAGPYHLMPLLPIAAVFAARPLGRLTGSTPLDPIVRRAAAAFITAAALVATAQQSHFMSIMSERRERTEMADVEQFVAAHPGTVEMAYGQTEALALVRPILVFRNNSYLIDQPAVREHHLQGLPLPPATLAAIASCRVNYFLVPKGESPFAARNAYAAVFRQPIFPDALRAAFHQRYRRVGDTNYYDVWQCVAKDRP